MPQKKGPDEKEPEQRKSQPRVLSNPAERVPNAGPEGGYAFPFARSSEEDEIREMYGWGV